MWQGIFRFLPLRRLFDNADALNLADLFAGEGLHLFGFGEGFGFAGF